MSNGFEDDILKLFEKRVYDIAGTTPKSLSVKYNGKKIKENDFRSHAKLYFRDSKRAHSNFWYEKVNDRWEIIFAIPDTNNYEYQHDNSCE